MRRLLPALLAVWAVHAGAEEPVERRFQLVATPLAAQINGKFVQHFGSSLALSWSPRAGLALRLTGEGNWLATPSSFNEELIYKVRAEAQAATQLIVPWAVHARVELSPILGELQLGAGGRARCALFIGVGAGLAATRIQLPALQGQPASTGDTGLRPVASATLGLRAQLTDRIGVRFELQDLVFSTRVDTVNGCNVPDLSMLDLILGPDRPLGAGCRIEAFNPRDILFARELIRVSSSDIAHLLSFRVGADVAF